MDSPYVKQKCRAGHDGTHLLFLLFETGAREFLCPRMSSQPRQYGNTLSQTNKNRKASLGRHVCEEAIGGAGFWGKETPEQGHQSGLRASEENSAPPPCSALSRSMEVHVKGFVVLPELYYDRGNHHEFVSLVKDLARPGEITQSQAFDFEFTHVEKPYESYTGQNVKLR